MKKALCFRLLEFFVFFDVKKNDVKKPMYNKRCNMEKNSKIYVAGHNGLVGSAIWNNLKARGNNNLVGRSHKELDLTDQ